MEEYKDEYTSFEGTSKLNTIIGTAFRVCFFGTLCIYSIYKTNVL